MRDTVHRNGDGKNIHEMVDSERKFSRKEDGVFPVAIARIMGRAA